VRCTRFHDITSDNWIIGVGIRHVGDGDRSRRLSKDSDAFAISSKCTYVIAEPFKCQALIEQAGVLLNPGCSREPKDIQTVAVEMLAECRKAAKGPTLL